MRREDEQKVKDRVDIGIFKEIYFFLNLFLKKEFFEVIFLKKSQNKNFHKKVFYFLKLIQLKIS